MLERVSPAVKEYLVCCIPIANIIAHSWASSPVDLGVNPDQDTIKSRVDEAGERHSRFFRSYMFGVLTQTIVAISSLALAVLCAPVAPVVSVLALFSFACFGLSAAVSIPAYLFQSKIKITARWQQ